MDDATFTVQLALRGIHEIYLAGNPEPVLNSVLQAETREGAAAIASALALVGAAAMHEIERLGGPGAAERWWDAELDKLE
jgi:hypothetical protein